MSRLSELAISKRSVTILLAAALFIAGVSAWGSLKQELLPDIEFPIITVIAPFPGAGSADVADQVAEPIERAISGVPRLETVQSTSANSIALVIAQFAYGTDVKEATAAIEAGIADAGLAGQRRAVGLGPQHQRVTGHHRVGRGHLGGRPRGRGRDRPDRDHPRDRGARGSRPRRRDRRPRGAPPDHAGSRPPRRGGHVGRPDHGRPDRQQPDPAGRPAVRRRDEDPGVDDRDDHVAGAGRIDGRRLHPARSGGPDRTGRLRPARGVRGPECPSAVRATRRRADSPRADHDR